MMFFQMFPTTFTWKKHQITCRVTYCISEHVQGCNIFSGTVWCVTWLLQWLKVTKWHLSHSPTLSVPLLSTVGVNYPAQVWTPQGFDGVQQRLDQCWRAAVDSYGNQLLGSVCDLDGFSKWRAIWYILLILTTFFQRHVMFDVKYYNITMDGLTAILLPMSDGYLTWEGEPGFRIWEFSEQLDQGLRLFHTWDGLKSNKISSCRR